MSSRFEICTSSGCELEAVAGEAEGVDDDADEAAACELLVSSFFQRLKGDKNVSKTLFFFLISASAGGVGAGNSVGAPG